MAILKGAEPFILPGGEKGILAVHGFTGSPSEMRPLAEFLHKTGYTVLAPRLCGHGTTPYEMAKTRWLHWYAAVEDGYHLLSNLCREITVVGMSMGGLLSLKLAAEYPVHKVVSVASPIYLQDKRLPLLPVYRLLRSYVTARRRRYDAGPAYSVGYDETPLGSLSSLLSLIRQVKPLLPSITAPALVIQSEAEHTVRPDSADYIYQNLGSPDKEMFWLKRSGHVVILDMEREAVFQKIREFLAAP